MEGIKYITVILRYKVLLVGLLPMGLEGRESGRAQKMDMRCWGCLLETSLDSVKVYLIYEVSTSAEFRGYLLDIS